jgi:hypothetical protein
MEKEATELGIFQCLGCLLFFHRGLIKGKEKKHASHKEKSLFACQPYVNATLITGSIRELVLLPLYIDEDEWLAANGKF